MLETGFVFMAATSATLANPARQHPTSEELSVGKIKFKASTDERKKVIYDAGEPELGFHRREEKGW
jgi:hypothetical protein